MPPGTLSGTKTWKAIFAVELRTKTLQSRLRTQIKTNIDKDSAYSALLLSSTRITESHLLHSTVFEILSKLGFCEEKNFSFFSDYYKNWDISHIWNQIITEKKITYNKDRLKSVKREKEVEFRVKLALSWARYSDN